MGDTDETKIFLKPINKEKKEEPSIEDSLLAEEGEVLIWANTGPDEKTIFINIGNATMSMPEGVFYTLTKLTQNATKTLLSLN